MPSRKSLIGGALILAIFTCLLIEALTTVLQYQEFLPPAFQGAWATLIGLALTLYALGAVILGAWMILRPAGALGEWNRRFTLTASLPGAFFLALMPAFSGIVVAVLTRQSAWGFYLACLGLPAVIVYLVLALWKAGRSAENPQEAPDPPQGAPGS